MRLAKALTTTALVASVLAPACGNSHSAERNPSSEVPSGHVRIAGIVLKWIVGEKPRNFERIEPLIREAAAGGAQIVSTAESFLDGYAVQDQSISLEDYRALGEPIPDGEYFRRLAALADELDVYLVVGITEADGEHRYNAAVIIDPEGEVAGKYHKQSIGFEKGRNTPGDSSPVFGTPYGNVGLMVCADRREEAIARRLVENGADFLIVPSGGSFGRRNDRILRARSKENSTYIVFVHPAEFLVTAPDGSIVSRAVLSGERSIDRKHRGTRADKSEVFYFDLPVSE